MPISQRNKLYYTPEQYELAKQNTNALEYAMQQGYDLVRKGQYYTLREHDSMVFTPRGAWFWNSRGMSGRALEFMTLYEGKSFSEAVLTLAGELGSGAPAITASHDTKTIEKPPFILPEHSDTSRHLFAYLCKTRHLDKQTVEKMIEQEILYESVYHSPTGKSLYNACFVSLDGMGNPCSAYQRGMNTFGSAFKAEVPGGDKNWGWTLRGENANKLYVFEAAIDAASFVSLQSRQGYNPYSGNDFLALGGLQYTPIENYLRRHDHVAEVFLMLDADTPGREAAKRFSEKLTQHGYQVKTMEPEYGKDWNDTLGNYVLTHSQSKQFTTPVR